MLVLQEVHVFGAYCNFVHRSGTFATRRMVSDMSNVCCFSAQKMNYFIAWIYDFNYLHCERNIFISSLLK
jgi:hypothetical protein